VYSIRNTLWLAIGCAILLQLRAANAVAAVSTITIFSPANNRNLSFQVYTPPGYTTDTARRYPVVISLHGIGGTSLQRANLYGPTLDVRTNSAELLPMIWLFPDGQDNAFYGDAFDGHKQVYSHIVHESLPYLDANFRTIAGRDFHAMEGFSMGGFGASMITAKRTDLFSAVAEYGGALAKWQNLLPEVAMEMYNGVEANFVPYSLWDQTAENAAALRTTVNYKMIVGDADGQLNSNTRFRDNLLSLQIEPHFQTLPGVEHLGGSYLTEGSGLRFLSAHFAANFQRSGDFDRDGDTDANDYTAWRSTFGSATALAADGNQNGIVDAADYLVWRNRFNFAHAASTAAAPEPPTAWLWLVIGLGAKTASRFTRRAPSLPRCDADP
jgi:S-formylglutathione hydrolase FrmB